MSQYLDKDGVSYLWSKIKALELPNPNAISVYYNTTKAFDYDGSTALSLSIKQGDNITVSGNSSGEITISGTPDTKNTAGSTQDSAKLYLVGAKSQAENPQTYSNNKVYIDGNKLYSNETEVSVVGHGHQISDVSGLETALSDLASDISTIPKFAIEVVQALPTTDISKTTIYLVPSDVTGGDSGDTPNLYTEYIRITRNDTDVWEKLGEQRLDISNKVEGLSTVTSGDIVTWGADGTTVQDSGKSISTTVTNSDDIIPTGAAVQTYISGNAVTSVATGIGLTGGPVTTTGTIKANLKSETALTADSETITNTTGRTYAVSADHSGYLAVNVPWTDTNTEVNVVESTAKSYLLGTTTSPTSTATGTTATANTGVYVTNGTITATNFSGTINGFSVATDVPADAVFTDTVYTHPTVTRTDSGDDDTPTSLDFSDTFIVVDSITSDTEGHVTAVTFKPYQLPASDNVDTKVTQNVLGNTDANYPVIVSYYESNSSTTTAQTVSRDSNIYINPSTHTLTATNIVASSITENGTALGSKYAPISHTHDWTDITTGVPTAGTNTLGLVKTTSSVSSTTGLTASPIIDGTVYYHDTTYSAGTGLSLSGTTINHSNSVTAVASETFLKVAYDTEGHITGTTAVTKSDITALGVPSEDTHYTTHLYVTTSSGTATTNVALANDNVYLRLFDDTTARESVKIKGTGVTSVTADASGNLIVDTPLTTITNAELDAICV